MAGRHGRLAGIVAAAIAVGVALGVTPTAPAQAPAESEARWVVREGHIDAIGAELDSVGAGRELALRAKYDVPGGTTTWVEYDDMVLVAPDAFKRTTPEVYTPGNDHSFIAPPGTEIWTFPLSQRPGAPWPGLSTESPTLAALGDRNILWRVDAVTGPDGQEAPGDLVLYGTDVGLNGDRYDIPVLSTKTGLPSARWVPQHIHSHFTWAMTEPGVYCVAMTLEAQLPAGTRLRDSEQLTVVVGDAIDADAVVPCGRTQPHPVAEPAVPHPDPDGGITVLGPGGASLVSTVANGELHTQVRLLDPVLAGPGTFHDPERVIFRRPAAAGGPGDANPPGFAKGRYGFLGQQILWDTTGIVPGQVSGDVRWKLVSARGPGDVALSVMGPRNDQMVGNTASPSDGPISLWPGAGHNWWAIAETWWFSRPGKYCVDLSWEATLPGGGTVRDEKTLTFVVDGPLDPSAGRDAEPRFQHDADTLTTTCADGAQPTRPEDVPNPWDVSNWDRTASGAVILTDDRVDVASVVEDGRLRTTLRDSTPEGLAQGGGDAYMHDPGDVVLQLTPLAEGRVSFRPEEWFLGPQYTRIWQSRQVPRAGVLSLGWSTQDIPPGAIDGDVAWTLTRVDGPAGFFIHRGGDGAPVTQIFNSADGLPDSVAVAPDTRTTGTWTFGAAGRYCLGFTRSATAGGDPVGDEFTLAVVVGNLDPRTVDPADCRTTSDPMPDPDPQPDPDPDPDLRPRPQPQPVPSPGGGATGGETPAAPVAATVAAASVRQVFGRPARLAVTVSPQATGEVSARVGGRTVTGALVGGRATLTLPAGALRPGRRSVRVSYAGTDGRFAPSAAVAAVRVVRAQPRVRVRPVGRAARRGGIARFAVAVAAQGVRPTGRVTVRFAGRAVTARLGANGRATIGVRVGVGARAGSATATVAYRGDALVAAGRATSVRVRMLG